MPNPKPGLINLLALSPIQRKIIVHLTREGPTDIDTLAQALGRDSAEVNQAIEVLSREGRIHLSSDGKAEVSLGRTRRKTLPARLWPALLATNRLYSAQEIATLSIAMPILQFARAKMSEFADHGPGHVLRVKSFATQLGYILGLSETEQHLLRAAAFFHDIGNVVERKRHHIISQETVEKLTATGKLPFSAAEAEIVGLLCRWHRKEYDPSRHDTLHNEPIRTGLLASILRITDAMDIDHRRSDYSERHARVLEFFYPEELPYWTSLEEILGVRIQCKPAVNLQVFTQPEVKDNMQIDMLRQDLESTPLDWSIQQLGVDNETVDTSSVSRGPLEKGLAQKALVAFPFDAHSLVMAALSCKHLRQAGYQVEPLCYPDTVESPAWLWREVLAESNPANYARLIIIGDRPDPALASDLLKTIGRWQKAGVKISRLNRHEATWPRLPDLLQYEVEVILGSDWCYFWGDDVSRTDLLWGQIAALCTRDPTQSTFGLQAQEEAMAKGLLKVVYDLIEQSADSEANWSDLARPILDRIEADDRAYFIDQAGSFGNEYTATTHSAQREGGVLRFRQAPGELPQAYYWVLEAAIERHGRAPDRGIKFKYPYAIATWPDENVIELMAISHWREEEAIPIRLLYPTDLGPPPEGNESTIRVRLPANQAKAVVRELINACNRS